MAEVIATRNVVLKVRRWRSIDAKGLKEALVKCQKTSVNEESMYQGICEFNACEYDAWRILRLETWWLVCHNGREIYLSLIHI